MLWTAEKLADYLGLTERRIRQLRDQKIFRERAKGLYEPFENIRHYIGYISGREGADGALSLAEEKAKLMRVRRESAELELEEKRGNYHRTEEVEAVCAGILLNFRAKLLSMPTTLAQQLADMKDPADVDALLDREIREALEELADMEF